MAEVGKRIHQRMLNGQMYGSKWNPFVRGLSSTVHGLLTLKAIDNPITRLLDMLSHRCLRLGLVPALQALDDPAVL